MDAWTGAAESPSNASKPGRTPQSCTWGELTLFRAYPVWLNAWDSPWSCGHPRHEGPLELTDTCRSCPDWTPRDGPDQR